MDKPVWRIGALALQTGLTVRTLHYYDSIGLVRASGRTAGGHRVYSAADVERLCAVVVLRRMGMSSAQIAVNLGGSSWDLLSIAQLQRRAVDAEMASLSVVRQRIEALIGHDDRAPADLIKTVRDLPLVSSAVGRVLALLPYDDVLDAQSRLAEMFGFLAGAVARNPDGEVAYAAVLAGSGFVHLHPPTQTVRPPGPDGVASAIVVATVGDVDHHAQHAVGRGAYVTYGPLDTNYGVREYGARDHAGHLWTFQSPIQGSHHEQ